MVVSPGLHLQPAPRRWRPAPAYWATAAVHGAAAVAALAQPALWPWWLGAVLLNHAAVASLSALPGNRWLGPALTHLPAGAARPEIALTFDDGPDPAITPRVLDLLDAAAARATFFVVGEQARRHPTLLREVLARGHAVENHSLRHAMTHGFLLPGALAREIAAAQTLIADITGVVPRFFRPPFGVRTPATEPALCRLGLACAQWSIRSLDAVDADATRVTARVTARLAAGDIVLLHDGLATGRRIEPPTVLAALPRILEAMRARGLRSVTLAQACADNAPLPAALPA